MNDPRNINEALKNELKPFKVTENSLKKCVCGHTIGFHHFNGLCKGSVTEGCKCEKIIYNPPL